MRRHRFEGSAMRSLPFQS